MTLKIRKCFVLSSLEMMMLTVVDKRRMPSRNESRGFEIKTIATEMQAKHNQPDAGKGGDQQFPEQREKGIGSWTLISDTI